MRIERIKVTDVDNAVSHVRGLLSSVPDVATAVQEVIADVRKRGDAALKEYTQQFDTNGREPLPLIVEESELQAALLSLDPSLKTSLRLALNNVQEVARAGCSGENKVSLPQGQMVTLTDIPVARAGIYAPGGNYPYPSTVIMAAGTAKAAGVKHVTVCVPPTSERDIHPVTLAACALCEVNVVCRVGGAQAIAALAYGTETISPVDVVVGPGNHYVQEAKRQVFGEVGIDSLAGPSDLLVIFAADAIARLVALDLLAQGEHGTQTLAIAVSPYSDALLAVEKQLQELSEQFPNVADATYVLMEVDSFATALTVSDTFAPEHLELVGVDAERLAPKVQNAGCVLVGRNGAAAFSDYVAGSNHVLPTGGSARFASELGAHHFCRRRAEVHIPDHAVAGLAAAGANLAAAEGFTAHKASMIARQQRVSPLTKH